MAATCVDLFGSIPLTEHVLTLHSFLDAETPSLAEFQVELPRGNDIAVTERYHQLWGYSTGSKKENEGTSICWIAPLVFFVFAVSW